MGSEAKWAVFIALVLGLFTVGAYYAGLDKKTCIDEVRSGCTDDQVSARECLARLCLECRSRCG